MNLISLPVRESPMVDESLTSFVRRYALAMGYETMTRLLNLVDGVKQLPHLDHLDRGPPLAALARLLGRSPEVLFKMTAHTFAKSLIPRKQDALPATSCDPKTLQRFFDPVHRRVCPACLKEDQPYERLTWAFRPLPVCLKHGLFLIDRCSTCERFAEAGRLELGVCRCGAKLAMAPSDLASLAARTLANITDAHLRGEPFLPLDLPSSAGFQWLERLRSATFRCSAWLRQSRDELGLPAWVSDEAVAWLAAAELLEQPHDRLFQFLATYQTVTKHRSTSTGVNRAFGFLLRDAERLERLGYPGPAELLRRYLLSNYTQGHLSTKTALFRGPQHRRQLRDRDWIPQTAAARHLGIRVLAVARLVEQQVLEGRVSAAGQHGRTIGLVSRVSLAAFERQLSAGLTLAQAAQRLGIGRHRVSELIQEAVLTGAVRVARTWRIPPESIDELLARIAQFPLVPVIAPDWRSLRDATRQFGPSHLNLARIVRLVIDGAVSARRDPRGADLRAVYVLPAELSEYCRSPSYSRSVTHGWSLQRLAHEIFPEQRFKDIVIRKWIRAGLLPAKRQAKQWYVAHDDVLRFRQEYCLAKEFCRTLQISRSTLARWECAGRLAAVYGRRTHPAAGASLFRRADLSRLLDRAA